MSYNQLAADPKNSTFRHVINYGERNIIGYSKKVNTNENSDKRRLLANTLNNLALPAFEKGAFEIRVFMRSFPNPLTYTENLILEVYEDGFTFHGVWREDYAMKTFLTRLLETKDKTHAIAVFNNYQNLIFKGSTHEELVEQCQISTSFLDRERVVRFYKALCKKYSWGDYSLEYQEPAPLQKPNITPINGAVSIGSLISNFQNQ